MQFLLYRKYNDGQIISHQVKKLSKILQDQKAMIFTLAYFLTTKHDYRKLLNLELFISLYFCIKVLRKTLEVIKEKYWHFLKTMTRYKQRKVKKSNKIGENQKILTFQHNFDHF